VAKKGRKRRGGRGVQPRKRPPAIRDRADLQGPTSTQALTTTETEVLGNEPTYEAAETSLPPLDVSEAPSDLPQTGWGLAGQYLSGRLKLTYGTLVRLSVIGGLVAVVWTYIQDNGADRLLDLSGFLWWAAKAGGFVLTITAFTVIACLVLRLTKRLE